MQVRYSLDLFALGCMPTAVELCEMSFRNWICVLCVAVLRAVRVCRLIYRQYPHTEKHLVRTKDEIAHLCVKPIV